MRMALLKQAAVSKGRAVLTLILLSGEYGELIMSANGTWDLIRRLKC